MDAPHDCVGNGGEFDFMLPLLKTVGSRSVNILAS